MTQDEALDVLNALPTLPRDMSLSGAALWSFGTLLHEALLRGWPMTDVRRLALIMLVNTVGSGVTEAELREDFEHALAQIEASKRPLQ